MYNAIVYIVLYFKQIMNYIGTMFFWKISKCTIFLRNQSGHSVFVSGDYQNFDVDFCLY